MSDSSIPKNKKPPGKTGEPVRVINPQKSMLFLRKLIETIPNPIFYKDAKGRYQGGNPAWADAIMGLPLEKIVGRTVYELPKQIPKNLADVYHQKDIELIKNRGKQEYESEVMCADGRHREFLFNKAVITNLDGNVLGLVGIMTDVTEKNKAQKVLTRESDKFRDFFHSEELGIYKTNLSGNVVMANPAFLNMFGYKSHDEFAGVNIQHHYAIPSDRSILINQLKKKELVRKNITFLRKNGTAFEVHLTARLYEDIITGYISEIKKADNLLRIPVCAWCNKIREHGRTPDKWVPPSDYFTAHKEEIKNPLTDYEFTHSICPSCEKNMYFEMDKYK